MSEFLLKTDLGVELEGRFRLEVHCYTTLREDDEMPLGYIKGWGLLMEVTGEQSPPYSRTIP